MIVVMGIFAADLIFHTPKLPAWTETVIGSGFGIGPGGKGSNQAIATARLGGTVEFLAKIGQDNFGAMARGIYANEGVGTRFLHESTDLPTGAAAIIIDDKAAENAIIVVPGAAAALTTDEIDAAADVIGSAAVFLTQLETPLPLVVHALRLARAKGVKTILNPAPAAALSADLLSLVDILTPNETEAAMLSGLPVTNTAEAEAAADALIARGAGAVIITLGEKGALLRQKGETILVPAVRAGALVDTTGAGDSFNAAIAVALSEGLPMAEALHFACAVAGLKVTRAGAGAGMPMRAEVDALLAAG
ncbi:ribokinase [Acidisoma cellulosilytica]|uniref:Ribokinase n=1 Tax=Acidisoma cellulosilyticum TaxID=2802395 RepID=A0A964E5S2_9PROT|nr:ribokinase [Acidisoma cellulosilyticum]MCB8882839.1 ribokinase [Acidisoma cellulosilyticum]